MNRFLLFFLISFVVHLAMGAVLLSKSNFFGGQKAGGEGSAEISDIGTLPSEEEEPPLTDTLTNSATGLEGEEMGEYTPPTLINVSEEAHVDQANQNPANPVAKAPVPPPIKAPAKTKLKKQKKVTPSQKTTSLKKKPSAKAVKKAKSSLNKPKTSDLKEKSAKPLGQAESAGQALPTSTKVKESQKPDSLISKNGDKSPPHAENQTATKDPQNELLNQGAKPVEEWVDEEERVLVSEKPKQEEWVDEDELLAPPAESSSSKSPQPAKQEQTAWVDEEEEIAEKEPNNPAPPIQVSKPFASAGVATTSLPPSPGNKAGSSNVPALDVSSARRHSQLKQVAGNPLPVYPEEALKKKWEGRAEVFYYVNPAGFVEKVQLKKSSGHRALDNAALRALARYRYHPGQEGWVRHPVEFFLELNKEIKKTATLGEGVRKSSTTQK